MTPRHRGACVAIAAGALGAVLAGCGGTSAATPPSDPPGSSSTSPTDAQKLVPPDSKWPAAGICQNTPGRGVDVVAVYPDAPEPRCYAVHANQRLEVVNHTDRFGSPGQTITVRFADFAPRSVEVGKSTLFDRPFGDYLMIGDHDLHLSTYAGSVFMCPEHVTGPYQRICG